MEKLTKENIYIDLRGKSKEELTDLYNFLISVGERQYNTLESFLNTNTKEWSFYLFGELNQWTHSVFSKKTEVTIKQLKEILQPIEGLQEQLEKAEAEVKRLKEAIEEDSKIKIDDWVVINETDTIFKVKENDFSYIDHRHYKITNPEFIKLLENEIK